MNPSTGTFISMDTYQGSIFDPTSLHKYLYANANPVMNSDPSGYSAENDIDFYKQAWITIDQAIEYERKLIGNMSNEVAYDYNVMQIGREIIHQLRNTGLEYAITYALEPYVGPDVAGLIANGIVTALDIAKNSRNKAIGNECGIVNNNNSPSTLYHYTNKDGMDGIIESQQLNPSLLTNNPKDCFYGEGQYLSDIVPGTKTPAQLSRIFIHNPYQGKQYSYYVEIDVTGLNVKYGRDNVFVIPNEKPLDLVGRMVSSGKV